MIVTAASRVYWAVTWFWISVWRLITPPQKSITDSPSSLDGPRDFSEAIAASFEALGDPATVNACISLIKSECHAQEMKKAAVGEKCTECDGTSISSDEEHVKEMSYDLNPVNNSYVLRIDTDQPAVDGVYVAACVTLTESDDDGNEGLKNGPQVDKEVENNGKNDAVEVDRPEEDSPMANLISQDKISNTNGCFTNGHHQTEDTDEDLSSASEVDSLELNKSVSQQAAFFKSLSMTDIKVNGNETPMDESNNKKIYGETVIEREIRLQKEREEAVAKERKVAQMAAILNKQNGQEHSISGDSIDSQQDLDICEKELNGLDSLEGESIGSDIVIAPKKYVKVRPVVEENDDVPVYRVLKESPVEREIRQTLEREAELKREKGLIPTEVNLPDTPVSPSWPVEQQQQQQQPLSNGSSNSTFASIKSRTLDLLTPKSERNLQKKLATSRIQQEIEEQTQREKSLRAEGAIKNTSEDFVDGWVLGRINSVEISSVENTVEVPAVVSPLSLPSTPDSELTDGTFCSPATTPSPVTTNGVVNKNVVPTIGVSTTNGVKLFLKKSNGSTTLPRPNGVKGVMQKFISSRGKIVPPFANRQKSGSISSFDGGDMFIREQLMDEIRKPPPKNFRRSYCSAESKIQAELKQMKAREEELRLVRKKQMALSQPNLSNIGIDDDDEVHFEDDSKHLNGFKEFARANSNPNLLDDASESSEEQVMKPKVIRRRTPLIEQWEKLAQQNNDN